jgi:hypothetical protein
MTLDATVGGAASNSYATLAEADAYFADRVTGNWDGSDTTKEQALIKATQYIDATYGRSFSGIKNTQAQALAWPRYHSLDGDGYEVNSLIIPTKIKYATIEAAKLIAGGADLQAELGRATRREKVGSLEVEYMEGAALTSRYPVVEGYVKGFLIAGASAGGNGFSNIRLVRG